MAIVIGAIFLLLIEPTQLKTKSLKSQIANHKQEIGSLEAQVQSIMESLEDDPNVALKKQITSLDEQISVVETQLQSETLSLIPASEMPRMLKNVLAASKGLKVIELQSIPPTAVLTEEQQSEGTELNLYRHGVMLTLEGKYFDIQRYLEKIESLEWQFYWKKFDYGVTQHPLATVKLELYTLSTNKAFIGV